MPRIPSNKKPKAANEDRVSLRIRSTFNNAILEALDEAGEMRLSRIGDMWQGYHASAPYVLPAERRVMLDAIETTVHEHRQHIGSRRHYTRHTLRLTRKAEKQGVDTARSPKNLVSDLDSLRRQERRLDEMLRRVDYHRKNPPSVTYAK
jgi:hypothetical protein